MENVLKVGSDSKHFLSWKYCQPIAQSWEYLNSITLIFYFNGHFVQISNFKELSDADYFSKNNEFATWLKDERDIFFSDLSSDSARKLFTKFVKDWNNKKLDSKYYDGIETGPRSSHNWKIKSDTKGRRSP
ncbi:hypothetical protein R6Q57_030204 [Mikania cordata]